MFHLQLAQYQSVKYEMYPLSPVSRHRLSEYLFICFIYRTLFPTAKFICKVDLMLSLQIVYVMSSVIEYLPWDFYSYRINKAIYEVRKLCDDYIFYYLVKL